MDGWRSRLEHLGDCLVTPARATLADVCLKEDRGTRQSAWTSHASQRPAISAFSVSQSSTAQRIWLPCPCFNSSSAWCTTKRLSIQNPRIAAWFSTRHTPLTISNRGVIVCAIEQFQYRLCSLNERDDACLYSEHNITRHRRETLGEHELESCAPRQRFLLLKGRTQPESMTLPLKRVSTSECYITTLATRRGCT